MCAGAGHPQLAEASGPLQLRLPSYRPAAEKAHWLIDRLLNQTSTAHTPVFMCMRVCVYAHVQVFATIGLGEEEARAKFGYLLDAFEIGAPPHGGECCAAAAAAAR